MNKLDEIIKQKGEYLIEFKRKRSTNKNSFKIKLYFKNSIFLIT